MTVVTKIGKEIMRNDSFHSKHYDRMTMMKQYDCEFKQGEVVMCINRNLDSSWTIFLIFISRNRKASIVTSDVLFYLRPKK